MTSRRNKSESLSLNKSQNEKLWKTKRRIKPKMSPCSCCPETQNVVVKNNKGEKRVVLKLNSGKKKESKEVSLLRKSVADENSSLSSDVIQKSAIENKSPILSDDKISDSEFVIISEADSCMSERKSPNSDHQATPQNYLFETCHADDKLVSGVSPDAVNPSFLDEDQPSSVLHRKLTTKASKSNVSVMSYGSNISFRENEKQKTYHSTFSSENALPLIEINVDTDFCDSTNSEAVLQSSGENSTNCFNSSNLDKNSQYQSTSIKNSNNSSESVLTNDSSEPGQSFDMALLCNTLSSSETTKENLICHDLNIEPLIKPVDFSYDEHNPFTTYVDISVLKAAYDYILENAISNIPVPSSTMPFETFIDNNSEQTNSRTNVNEISNYNTTDSQPELINAMCSENSEKLNELISDSFISSFDLNVCSNELEDNLMPNLNESSMEISENPTEVEHKKRRGNRTSKRLQNKKAKPKSYSVLDETACDMGDETEAEESVPSKTPKARDQLPSDVCSSPALPLTVKNEEEEFENNQRQVLPSETVCLLNKSPKENSSKSSKAKRRRRKFNWSRKKKCSKRNLVTEKNNNFKEYLCDTCDESEVEENIYDMASEACSQLPLDTPALSGSAESDRDKLSENIEYERIICSIKKKKYEKEEHSSEILEIQENINQIIIDESLDSINVGDSEMIPLFNQFEPDHQSNSLDMYNTSMPQYLTNDNTYSDENLSSSQTLSQDSSSCGENKINTRLQKRKRNSVIMPMDDEDKNHEMNTSNDTEKSRCTSTISKRDKGDKTGRKKFKQIDTFSYVSIDANANNREKNHDQSEQNVFRTEKNYTESVDIEFRETEHREGHFTSASEIVSSTEYYTGEQVNIEIPESTLDNKSLNESFEKVIVVPLEKLNDAIFTKHFKAINDVQDENSFNLTLPTENENFYSNPGNTLETTNRKNSEQIFDSERVLVKENMTAIHTLDSISMDRDKSEALKIDKQTKKISPNKKSGAASLKNKQALGVSSKTSEGVFDSVESDGKPQNNLKTKSCETKLISPGKNINALSSKMKHASSAKNDISPSKNKNISTISSEMKHVSPSKNISPSKKKNINTVSSKNRHVSPSKNNITISPNENNVSPVKDLSTSPSNFESKSPRKKSSISLTLKNVTLKSKRGTRNNSATKEPKEGIFGEDISHKATAFEDQSDLPLETCISYENLGSENVAVVEQNESLETDCVEENLVLPLEVPNVSNEQNVNSSDHTVSGKRNQKIRPKGSKDTLRKKSKTKDSKFLEEKTDSESKGQTKLKKKKISNSLLSSEESFEENKEESKQLKSKDLENLTNGKEKNIYKKSSSEKNSSQNFRQSQQETDLLNALLPFNNSSILNGEKSLKDLSRNSKPIPKLSQKIKIPNPDSSMQINKEILEINDSLEKEYTAQNCDNTDLIKNSALKNNLNDTLSSKMSHSSNDELVLMEDCLDFEPDQSEDMVFKSSVDNNPIDSVPTIQNENAGPAFSQQEFPSDFLSNHNFDSSRKNWLSEDDSDSDEELNFKRRGHRKKKETCDLPDSLQKNVDLELHIPLNESEYNDDIENDVTVPNENADWCTMKSYSEDPDTNSSKSDPLGVLKSKVSSGYAGFKNELIKIRELCSKDKAEEAIEVANRYLAVSNSDVKMCILRVLLISVFHFNFKAAKNNNLNSKIFDDIVNLIQNSKVCNKQLASFFIVRCCAHPDLNPYSKQLFDYCQEKNIPLSNEAVNAFCEVEKSKEVPLPDLLRYLRYIKLVCQKRVPKDLLNLALEKCETSMFADMHHICELLHDISKSEVEETCLVKFLCLCFKESMWQYVAEMFIVWGFKNSLSLNIYTALATDHRNVGKYFRKFANYVHGREGSLSTELTDKFSLELKCTFGQIGIALMLKSFLKSDLDNALEILFTLHMYNVNYYQLELGIKKNCDMTNSDSEAEEFSSKIFPFYVVFVALDICLQLNRPKDAFTIFQDCSWVTFDSVEDDVQTYITKERCERLLKLVPLLNNQDSLDDGWDALEKLLTSIKHDSLPEFVQDNAKSLGRIYEEYMISLLNSEKISYAYLLYQYSLGPKKDLFTMSSDVLRGLIVAFTKDSRIAAAKSLLLIGIMKKIYPVQKPELETFPWEITLMTNWTAIEIEVVVEWYTEILFPLLRNKNNETFEKWFSVKIVFNITPPNSSKVECLNEAVTDSKYYITKTRNVLQSMNPPLEVTEITKENALCITSNSLYSFWKNRCPDAATFDLQFVTSQNKFSFGAGEKGSKERDSSRFVPEFFSKTSETPKHPSEEKSYQIADQPSQYYSPRSPASSPESLFSMINEAKANSSKSIQLATTPEKTPPAQNSRNSNSPRSNGYVSGYNSAFYGSETNDELQQQILFPQRFQSTPNVFSRRNKSPRQSLENQQLAFAGANQSYNENSCMPHHSNNSFRPNFSSLGLFPTPNQPPKFTSPLLPTPVRSASPKNCLNSSDNSFLENNYTKQVDSSVRQKSPAATDRSLINHQDNTAIRRSVEGPDVSHPSVRNVNVNKQPSICRLSNQIKKPALPTPSKIGSKKSKGIPQTPKNKRKMITFNKTPMKIHKTPLQNKISKAVKVYYSSRTVGDSSKKDLTSQFAVNNETDSTDNSVTNNQRISPPLNAQFARSGPVSVSNAPQCSSQLGSIKKVRKKTVTKDKEFLNFTVCVTSKARTVNSSSSQNLSVLKQSVPDKDDNEERNKEESRVSLQNSVPISNSSLNQNLPKHFKTIQNNPGMIKGGQKSLKEKSSTSFQTPDSEAQIPNLPADSKSIQSSNKRDEISININFKNPGASSSTVHSFKRPASQNFMPLSRSIKNNSKTNSTSLGNDNVSPSKSYSTNIVLNSSASEHPLISKQNFEIKLANNSKNEDESCSLASNNLKSVSPKSFNINQQRRPVNELNKPHTSVVNTSPNQSGNSVPKNKITLTRTVNLNRVTNTDTKNVTVNKLSLDNKITSTQTFKPVIKRSDFRTTLNNWVHSWQETHGSVPPVPSIPGGRHGDPKFEVKKIPAESSQSFEPLNRSASCGEEDFKKIKQFLKVKVTLRHKSISLEEQDNRASSLAHAFIQNNEAITKLDKTTMKLLCEFADSNV